MHLNSFDKGEFPHVTRIPSIQLRDLPFITLGPWAVLKLTTGLQLFTPYSFLKKFS